MKRIYGLTAAFFTALTALPLAAAAKPAQRPEASPAPAKVTPEQVWPASLTRMAGKYRFVQVASPGGLWQKTLSGGKEEVQQVSMSQLPSSLRERIEKAEIQILELQMPTTVNASMEKSPGVGGMLRHYTEEARGRLVMRGVPGIGSREGDSGEYDGEVVFGIDHTSLTNPTVPGVWITRFNTEMTWGAATLDYAELTAQKPAKKGEEEAEPEYPIFNARILRSGMEIFAFIQWLDPEAVQKGDRREIYGCVRLLRVNEAPAPPPTAPVQS
jgi:hypothetical protein